MINTLEYTEIKQISNIICNLYNDEIPLHNRLINFLNDIMQIIYYDKSTLLFYYMDRDGVYHKHSSVSINFDPEKSMVEKYNSYYCHIDDTLPVFDQKSPIVFKGSSFFNSKKREKNAYWTEYLLPSNCIYSLEGNLKLNHETLRGAFNLYRGAEKNDFTDKDVAIMSLLQPHLSNVLKDYGHENNNTSIFFLLENYNCVGIAVLDSTYQVIHSNNAYKKFMEYTVENDIGEVSTHMIRDKIYSLCTNLASQNLENSIEYKLESAPIYIVISKIPESNGYNKGKFSCMIYDLSYFYNKALDQTKEKYELTMREFDVLKSVLNGMSNEEIAAEKYLSLPTVKKTLASI